MKNLFACMGGVFATLVFIAVLSLTSCANSAGSGSGENPQDSQLKINYALGDPPKSEQLPEESYTVIEDEDSEGIYIEFDIPESEKYWTTRVYIEGLGAVAEEVQYTDTNKTRGCFYYPFVEAGKEYTIRFVFLRDEDRDENNPDISFGHLGDDGSIGWFETKVKAGSQSKGEVRFTDKGQIDVKKNGEFKFTKKPAFQNEELLTGDNYDWEVEIGLVEGISWTHGAERRTKWHSMQETISIDNIYYTINLYKDQENEKTENKYSIDFICVRPILYYEYKGKTYRYQWDSFVREIYYPPRNPDGIYVELDLPKKEFSRCDVTIDGIGKVAEGVTPLEENPARASFFYPFLEADKEYTIHFSFKDIEIPDSEGFVRYTTKNDTISEVKMNVTAGPRAKGEVRLPWGNRASLRTDSKCNITYFQKPTFENEELLGDDWMVEIGLMEGVSWNHGDERRTKWHCAVAIPKRDFDTVVNKNLRDLEMSPGDDPCEHDHNIDCICVRPIMSYEHNGKTYNYMWDGDAYDVHYPLNADFQEIDIDNPADVAKIIGTWTQNEEGDYETEHSLAKVHAVYNETLVIDDTNVHKSYICTYKKANGAPFTKQEIIDGFCHDYLSNDLPDNYIDFEVGEFYNDWELEWNPNPTMYIYKIYQLHSDMTLSNDWGTLTDKDELKETLSQYFENINNYEYNYFRTCELKLSKDGSQLYIFWTDKDDEYYDEWTDVYKRQ